MPIRVVKETSQDETVGFETLVTIIETNRDRVRTMGNMILTVSGIILSATFAILLFIFDKGGMSQTFLVIAVVLFGGSILLNLVSIYFSIASSLLKTRYSITTKVNVVTDLMALFHSELQLVRVSFIFVLIALLFITFGTAAFVYARWP